MTNKIGSLEKTISEKETEISELNSTLTNEKNKSLEENEKLNVEINSTKTALQERESEIASLTSEINELKAFKKSTEDKELVAELNNSLARYTDKEKEAAKEKIETFSAEPSREKMVTILSEINSYITKTILEQRESKNNKTELNSAADVYGDILELNNNGDKMPYEDLY